MISEISGRFEATYNFQTHRLVGNRIAHIEAVPLDPHAKTLPEPTSHTPVRCRQPGTRDPPRGPLPKGHTGTPVVVTIPEPFPEMTTVEIDRARIQRTLPKVSMDPPAYRPHPGTNLDQIRATPARGRPRGSSPNAEVLFRQHSNTVNLAMKFGFHIQKGPGCLSMMVECPSYQGTLHPTRFSFSVHKFTVSANIRRKCHGPEPFGKGE